ncbi:MAG: hypothetical protein HFJ75_00225 [Eggerthellaceae bacterium]|nr:hypothetical protein [Eggerthellaceae bacterium]
MARDFYCVCRDCDTEFFRYCIEEGGGRQCEDAIARMCEKGDYGEVPKYLLSEACPLPISVRISPCIYRCPECGMIAEYWRLTMSHHQEHVGSIEEVDPRVWEEKRALFPCPSGCDAYMDGPYEGDEALGVVEEHAPSVCPNCGSGNVHPAINFYFT